MTYPEFTEWIKTFNFFNWLAVAAFILALFGFLNSFLSLRDRFKDWYSTRSKKSFAKRLKALQNKSLKVKEFQKSKEEFTRELLHKSFNLLFFVIFGLIFCVTGLFQRELTGPGPPILFCYGASIFVFFISVLYCFNIQSFFENVKLGTLSHRIRDLVQNGQRKGYLNEEQANEILKEESLPAF